MRKIFLLLAFAVVIIAGIFYFEVRFGAASDSIDVTTIDFKEDEFNVLDERFVSFSIDTAKIVGGVWWDAEETKDFGLLLDDPALMAYASNLGPAYLRIGGTAADEVYYSLDGSKKPFDYRYELTKESWDGINYFAKAIDADIIFTLNAGKASRNEGIWESTNARQLISYTIEKDYPVRVWEFGNEPNAFPYFQGFSVSEETYCVDALNLRSVLDELGSDAKLAAGGVIYQPRFGEINPFLREFVSFCGDAIDIVPWHYYPQQSERCPIGVRYAKPLLLTNPKKLDGPTKIAQSVDEILDKHNSDAEVWIGETGNAMCGGQPELSDRYISGMWWLDMLGQAAQGGVKVVVRQSLIGSDYGLIDAEELYPNPDYWNSILWKKFMGKISFETINEGSSKIRTYVHCSPKGDGSMSLLAINLDNSAELLDLSNFKGKKKAYFITSDDIFSKNMKINGEDIRQENFGLVMPEPEIVQEEFLLDGYSYAFFEMSDLNFKECFYGPDGS